jgi:uncharacterized lipoprotein YajG
MNLHTATTTSFQYRFLRALLLLAVTVVLFTACSEGAKQSGTASTEPAASKEASNTGRMASTGSVPSDVAKAIDQVTSKPRYEHSSWGALD